jgi:hypothetical protein
MDEAGTRKPWYRLRNIFLLLILLVIGLAGQQVYLALTSVPGTSVDYGQKMADLAWSLRPGLKPEDNALPLIEKAVRLKEKAREELSAADPRLPLSTGADFGILYNDFNESGINADAVAAERETFNRQRDLARQMLDKYREVGVFDTLALAAAKPVTIRQKHEGRLMEILLPDLGACRDFARANAARMRLARSAADQSDFVAAYEQSHGLARLCTTEPIIISNLVGVAISALNSAETRKAIMAGELNPQTLRDLAAAMDRQGGLEPMSHAVKGEHLFALDIIQWTHTDDGRGDGRRIVSESMTLRSWSGEPKTRPTTRLVNLAAPFYPSKRQMTAKTDEFYEKLGELAGLPFHARQQSSWSADGFVTTLPWNYDILKVVAPALSRATMSSDLSVTELAGLRILVAIEQYRAERGSLPATLDELVPAYLPKLPVDPFAGDGKFRYRVLAAPDALKRTYLLYSVGFNGKDDSGNEELAEPTTPGQPTQLRATDTVINRIDVLK